MSSTSAFPAWSVTIGSAPLVTVNINIEGKVENSDEVKNVEGPWRDHNLGVMQGTLSHPDRPLPRPTPRRWGNRNRFAFSHGW